jgi:hypothetical protein
LSGGAVVVGWVVGWCSQNRTRVWTVVTVARGTAVARVDAASAVERRGRWRGHHHRGNDDDRDE